MKARLASLAAAAGRDHREAGQEHHAGQPGEHGPAAAALRGVPAAQTKQAIAKQVKPIPPAAKCSSPCQEIAPGPSGVPTGKPSAGSARKIPAAIRLAP